METIKTVCAGCSKHLKGDKDAQKISHGVCRACLSKLYPEFAADIISDMEKDGAEVL